MSEGTASAILRGQPRTEDLECASFDADLYEVGVGDSGYRTRNNPDQPYERGTVTYRKAFHCKSHAIIHGKLSGNSTEPATLLVYDFDFHLPLPGRIISLWATLTFHGRGIEVTKFTPQGRFTFAQSSQDESHVRGGSGRAGISQFGAELDGSWKDETTVTRTTNDSATLQGYFICGDFGEEIGVKWELEENRSIKKGIPSFLRTALLLKRSDDAEFNATVDFKVKMDWKSEVRHFIGRNNTDDPVIYDPTRAPTDDSGIAGLDLENLESSFQAADFFNIISHTKVEGVVKVKKL